jgi:hypothetical protein
MMGIAGTSTLETYSRSSQIVLLAIISLSMISVAVYKANCTTVSSIGGITQFDSSAKAVGLFLLNVVIAAASIYASYVYLGANAS